MSACPVPYAQGLAGARGALRLMAKAQAAGKLRVPEREKRWLDLLQAQVEELPPDGTALLKEVRERRGEVLFDPAEYGL